MIFPVDMYVVDSQYDDQVSIPSVKYELVAMVYTHYSSEGST